MFIKKITFLALLALPNFLCSMTLEEKIGQLLVVHFNGEEITDEARAFIEEVHVGGFLYYNFSNGELSFPKVSALSAELQAFAKATGSPPLFLAVDQEGGCVARCKEGFTQFPGNEALGKIGDPFLTRRVAKQMGSELSLAGITLNLAPVVDINSNPKNIVIGSRSFGEEKGVVISLAKEMIIGFQEGGVLTCLKHFPGHGDVSVDSHEATPVTHKTLAELWEYELVPFAALAPFTDAVMTAHMRVPSVDEEHIATSSKKLVDILRKDMHFNRVVIADSLAMEGFLQSVPSLEEGVLRELLAGHDCLLLGGKQLHGAKKGFELTLEDVRGLHRFLVRAVKDGRLPLEHVEASVQRILALKARIKPVEEEVPRPNYELAKEVSDRLFDK